MANNEQGSLLSTMTANYVFKYHENNFMITMTNKYNSNNDEPTIITAKGDKHWIKYGDDSDDMDYRRYGKLHRTDDKPAYISKKGDKHWYINGILHRIKGPAVEYANGRKSWYLDGKLLKCNSQEEFAKHVKKYLMILAFQ